MLDIVLGLIIGIASGLVQFILLYKFITTVTGGKMGSKTIIFAVTQFLLPFTVLLLCGFFLPDSLMWVGIGMASALIISSGIRFYIYAKSDKNTKSSKDSKSGNKSKSEKRDKSAKNDKSIKSDKSKKPSKKKKAKKK